MMLKKMVLVGICVAVFSSTSVSFAEDVYVTPRGKKYHKASCRLLKKSKTAVLDKLAAIEKGYDPCGVCLKDEEKPSPRRVQNKKSKESRTK